MSKIDIKQLINVKEDDSGDVKLLSYIGDDSELSLNFSFKNRKCFLKNESNRFVKFMIRHGNYTFESINIAQGVSFDIDSLSIEKYGDFSMILDFTLTSTLNNWCFNYDHICVSSSFEDDNNDCNRIFVTGDILSSHEKEK